MQYSGPATALAEHHTAWLQYVRVPPLAREWQAGIYAQGRPEPCRVSAHSGNDPSREEVPQGAARAVKPPSIQNEDKPAEGGKLVSFRLLVKAT